MTSNDHKPSRDEDQAALPRPVQEHLARQLRAAYVETQDKPAFLGDPALPPAFDDQLYALRSGEVARERARAGAHGLAAVSTALEEPEQPEGAPDDGG